MLGEPQEVTVATVPGCDNLVDWMNIFRITQASPMTHGAAAFIDMGDSDKCCSLQFPRHSLVR